MSFTKPVTELFSISEVHRRVRQRGVGKTYGGRRNLKYEEAFDEEATALFKTHMEARGLTVAGKPPVVRVRHSQGVYVTGEVYA